MKNIIKYIFWLFFLSSFFLLTAQSKIKYSDFTPQLKSDLKDTTKSIVSDTATVHDAALQSDMGDTATAIRDEAYQQKQLMNYLYKWRADVSYDQKFAVDTLSICVLGASHAAGLYPQIFYLGQQRLGNAGAGFLSFYTPAGQALQPASAPGATLCAFTETSGWDLVELSTDDGLWGVDGYTYVSNTNTDTMAWTTQKNPFDLYRIYYTQRSANAGEFVYKIDGVAIDTVDTQSAGADSLKYIEASATIGNHRLAISLETTGTDSVIFCGVEFINTANGGIRGIPLTHGGSYTEQWKDHNAYLKAFFTVVDPSLIIISLGANDVTYRTVDEFESDMSALLDSIQSVSDASILLLSAQSQGNKDTYELEDAQNDSLELQHAKLIDLSQAKSIGFWDKYYFLPDWVTASDLGLTNYPTDGVHSNLKGRLYVANEIARVLFDNYGGIEEAIIVNESQKNIIGDGVGIADNYLDRDMTYSTGFGYSIFGDATGDHNQGMGYLAGLTSSGIHNNHFGFSAGRNNTGSNSNFFGRETGYNNTGQSVNCFGMKAGYENTANYSNFFGSEAGYENTGIYANCFGSFAGQYNTGAYVNLFGGYAGQYNIGQSSILMDFKAGQYNTGTYAIGLGYYTNRYNTGNYNIAIGGLSTGLYNEGTNILIGRSVHNDFLDDTGSQVLIDNTDIVDQSIYISGHGFGSVNAYRLLRFKEGTGSVAGMTDNTVYKFKIIHVDSLQSFGFTIGTPVAGNDTLVPQTQISNSIVIGHNVDPTASNQTTIGNASTTQAVIYGDLQPETLWTAAIDSITVDADTLKIRIGEQWYGIYEVGAPE